jgi:hypothetical protein
MRTCCTNRTGKNRGERTDQDKFLIITAVHNARYTTDSYERARVSVII